MDGREMNHMHTPLVAVEADLAAPSCGQVKRAKRTGRNHNEWGFSNRMLDVTMAWMAAK
jgi:glyceraldehyde-3-phosphate dehydrogenase/erythrose-4-phosphate dehydrogenase